LTLAQAYHAAGDTVKIVSGGMPAPMLRIPPDMLLQLPPVASDGVDFSTLLTEKGLPVDAAYMADRGRVLDAMYREFAPDVLITELFPFGRRMLRNEFRALLEQAKAQTRPPLICASIRDILAPPSKPAKAAFAHEMAQAFYDAVLVHSDPALTPLEASWPVTPELCKLLYYTGFVAPTPAGPHPDRIGAGEVIVSAGGGAVGAHVYEAALAAATLTPHPMRLLIGGQASEDRAAALRERAPDCVIIEPARPDFRQMLTHAAASVSLCGYNTALDILQAGTPAVFVPFDEGGEVEQGLRARALAQRAGMTMVMRDDLTAIRLAAAIDAVIANPPKRDSAYRFTGATRTVEMTRTMREVDL